MEGCELHQQRSGSSRDWETCTQTHLNLAQSGSCQAAPLVADPNAESLCSYGEATSSGSSKFSSGGGGRSTSRLLDTTEVQSGSSPAAGNGDKHPPKRHTATAAESQPDSDCTVIAGSLVETHLAGTAAGTEVTAPRAWEQHAARSHIGGSGGHLSGGSGGQPSGGSGGARIQPNDGGAVAPRSFSAQPAVRLPALGSEALLQRPGSISGAVGQSDVLRWPSLHILWLMK